MTEHLDVSTLAQYLDGAGTSDQRAGWDRHLSECADCRQELVETGRILASAPNARRTALLRLVPLAAAAAILLVWLGTSGRLPSGPVTRDPEPSSSATLAPTPLAPLGNVDRIKRLVWSAVPGATRYRVTLFTGEGHAAWQATSSDTFATLPDTLHVPVAAAQYWQVKAETGFGRWVESELVGFTVNQADSTR